MQHDSVIQQLSVGSVLLHQSNRKQKLFKTNRTKMLRLQPNYSLYFGFIMFKGINWSVLPAEPRSCLCQLPAGRFPSSAPHLGQQVVLQGNAEEQKAQHHKFASELIYSSPSSFGFWFHLRQSQSLSSPRLGSLQARPYSPCRWRSIPSPSCGPRRARRSLERTCFFEATCCKTK